MLADTGITAFLATTRPDAAREFYANVLGLRFVSDDGFALVFELRGAQLRIAKVEAFEPHAFTSLGWRVDDVPGTVSELTSRGVTFERYDGMGQDDLGIWHVPGGHGGVAWFKDPDGNLLSISGDVGQ